MPYTPYPYGWWNACVSHLEIYDCSSRAVVFYRAHEFIESTNSLSNYNICWEFADIRAIWMLRAEDGGCRWRALRSSLLLTVYASTAVIFNIIIFSLQLADREDNWDEFELLTLPLYPLFVYSKINMKNIHINFCFGGSSYNHIHSASYDSWGGLQMPRLSICNVREKASTSNG